MHETPCIICNQAGREPSIEHIIPQSIGNVHYILHKGIVCKHCNNKIARIESAVLNNRYFLEKRKPHLLETLPDRPLPLETQQRFLLKMAYEALYKSRNKVWSSLDHDRCRSFILHGGTWPLINRETTALNFKSIPRWWNAYVLKRNKIFLGYQVSIQQEISVQFRYYGLQMTMRIH